MDLKQIEEARALAAPVIWAITATDKSPYMVVQYVPDLGTGGAAATLDVADARGTLTLTVDAAAPAGLDDIGASGVIDLTSTDYDTMGELVDYINGKIAWRAYLVSALRADAVGDMIAIGTAASCIGANGYTIYADSSVTKTESIVVSGEKFVSNGINGHVKDYEDRCENTLLYGAIKATCASVDSMVLRYYTGKQGSTEVQVGSDVTLTNSTVKEQGEANLTTPYVQSTRGQRLIVRVVATSAQPMTSPVFNVIGTVAVLKNDRVVTEDNW